MTIGRNPRIVTPADVEAMRAKFLAGDYAGVLDDDRRLRGAGDWDAPPGVSRSALNERMNYYAAWPRPANSS